MKKKEQRFPDSSCPSSTHSLPILSLFTELHLVQLRKMR